MGARGGREDGRETEEAAQGEMGGKWREVRMEQRGEGNRRRWMEAARKGRQEGGRRKLVSKYQLLLTIP